MKFSQKDEILRGLKFPPLHLEKECVGSLKRKWNSFEEPRVLFEDFPRGDALAGVNSEMLVGSRPSLEQILMVLQRFFGSPNLIMEQIIEAQGRLKYFVHCLPASLAMRF
jgi:hypothetical protein